MMGKNWRLPRPSAQPQSLRFLRLSGGLLLLISGCQGLGIPGFPPAPPPSEPLPSEPIPTLSSSSALETLERSLYQQVNQYRQQQKLPPLHLSAYLNQQARFQSERMAIANRLLDPDDFAERQTAIANVLSFQTLTANVAMIEGKGEMTPALLQKSFKNWLKSSPQRQNLAGDFDLTGVGISQNKDKNYFITQIFLKKATASAARSPNAPLSPLSRSVPRPSKNKPRQSGKVPDSDPLVSALEITAFQQVNQYRLAQGLVPLRLEPQISQVARQHAQAMANKKATFSHDGFEQRAKTLKSRIPLQAVGENLAYIKGYDDIAATAVKGWINSPGHRKNMVGQYNLTGMGVAKNAAGEYYLSQLFVSEP